VGVEGERERDWVRQREWEGDKGFIQGSGWGKMRERYLSLLNYGCGPTESKVPLCSGTFKGVTQSHGSPLQLNQQPVTYIHRRGFLVNKLHT